MPQRSSRLLVSVISAMLLMFGAVACSDDEASDSGTNSANETSGEDAGDDRGDGEAVDSSGMGDEERPFGVNLSAMARALAGGTGADRHEVDGNTVHLIFDEGSVDDVKAAINCSVAVSMIAEDDRVVLVYPDGEVDCDDDN